jgi:putative protease
MATKKKVGNISHYFSKISVAVVDLSSELKSGDLITIEGPSTNIKQKVTSMQVEHKAVASAKKGDSVGLKVPDKVKEGDLVYKVTL